MDVPILEVNVYRTVLGFQADMTQNSTSRHLTISSAASPSWKGNIRYGGLVAGFIRRVALIRFESGLLIIAD